MNSFGEYLKSLRGKRSIREVSNKIGISHTYLSTLEKGFDPRTKKERKPTNDVLRKLSNYYDVDYLYLCWKAGLITEEELSAMHEMKEDHEKKSEIVQNLTEQGYTTSTNPNEPVYAIEDIFADERLLDYKRQYLTNEDKREILNYIEYLFQKKKNE